MNWRILVSRALHWLSLLVRLALAIVRPTHPPVMRGTSMCGGRLAHQAEFPLAGMGRDGADCDFVGLHASTIRRVGRGPLK